MYNPPRFTAVPWLHTRADLRAYGPPETTVEHGAAVTLGMLIPDPFGPGTSAVLSIHTADWKGIDGDVTVAITDRLVFGPELPTDVTFISNPIRRDYGEQ